MDNMQSDRTGRTIRPVENILPADTFWKRLKGLMGTRSLPDDTGLLLDPCNSVHTWYMKYPIDVLFLSREGQVLHVEDCLAPNRGPKTVREAAKVLELSGGQAARLKIGIGDLLDLSPKGA